MAVNPAKADVRGLFSFFQLCGKLKVSELCIASLYLPEVLSCLSLQHLKRTGWVNHGVKDPETVAGHMYRMAMMCFLFGTVGEDTTDGIAAKAGPGAKATGLGTCGKPLDRERCQL